MPRFAKLIELDGEEQVLLTLNENDDNDDYFNVVVRTDFNGFKAELALTYDSEENAINRIASFSQKDAVNFRSKIGNSFSSAEEFPVED